MYYVSLITKTLNTLEKDRINIFEEMIRVNDVYKKTSKWNLFKLDAISCDIYKIHKSYTRICSEIRMYEDLLEHAIKIEDMYLFTANV